VIGDRSWPAFVTWHLSVGDGPSDRAGAGASRTAPRPHRAAAASAGFVVTGPRRYALSPECWVELASAVNRSPSAPDQCESKPEAPAACDRADSFQPAIYLAKHIHLMILAVMNWRVEFHRTSCLNFEHWRNPSRTKSRL
jgi:hypothetical protein